MRPHRYAVITGASSGIGYELTCRAVEDGYAPIMVSRRETVLSEAAENIHKAYGIRPITYACNLSNADELTRLIEFLGDFEDIELAVNNAGLGYGGPFVDSSGEGEIQVLMVNVVALMRLSHYFLKRFSSRRAGYILNVASLAGFQPGPYMANYYASKAFVLSFTEALSVEARRANVVVTALCPGTTRTNFHAKADIEGTKLHSGLFGLVMSPRTVSKVGYKALKAGSAVVVPGYVNALAAFSVRVGPRGLIRRITASINSKANGSKSELSV